MRSSAIDVPFSAWTRAHDVYDAEQVLHNSRATNSSAKAIFWQN